MTLQILNSLLPRDNPKYFMLFYSSLFTTVTNLRALNIVSFTVFILIREWNNLKYLQAIHAVVAGGEKVFMWV